MHKIEVRRIAEEIWYEDPLVTIHDMIFNDRINQIARKANGEIYAESTIRNWIKDLCPDRKPGRRKSKKK